MCIRDRRQLDIPVVGAAEGALAVRERDETVPLVGGRGDDLDEQPLIVLVRPQGGSRLVVVRGDDETPAREVEAIELVEDQAGSDAAVVAIEVGEAARSVAEGAALGFEIAIAEPGLAPAPERQPEIGAAAQGEEPVLHARLADREVLFLLASLDPAPRIHPVTWIGAGLWVISVLGEAIADQQLRQFKRNPLNKGSVCRDGLWNFSRHPNYFFEWLIWVAFALLATASPWGWTAWACPPSTSTPNMARTR